MGPSGFDDLNSPKEYEEDLDEYLKGLEEYLLDLRIDQRNKIILEIRSEIETALRLKNQDIETIIKSLGKEFDLINRFRLQAGFPKATNHKKRNWFKIIILSMASFVIIGVIAVLIFIKSLTPIFEINQKDGMLTLLGGKINLYQDDETFFGGTRLKINKKELNKAEISGDLPGLNIDRINLVGENVDIALRSHDLETIKYKCQSKEAMNDFVAQIPDGYSFTLRGAIQCIFYFPVGVEIDGKFKQGFVNLRNLKQDVNIRVGNGHISWKQDNPANYQIRTKVSNGLVKGSLGKFSDDGNYRANLIIDNGNIHINP